MYLFNFQYIWSNTCKSFALKFTNCSADSIFIPYISFLVAPYGRYWVLDTDYTTHTMIYSCTDILGIFHISYAWILSRERTLDEAVKNRLFAKAESFGIKTSNFLKEDQTGCQWAFKMHGLYVFLNEFFVCFLNKLLT